MYVTRAKDAILSSEISYFTWTWKHLTWEKQLVLAVLTQEQRDEERGVLVHDIISLYESKTHKYEREKVVQLLAELQEQSLIARDTQSPEERFKVAAGLMREWLQRARPLEKFGRERPTHKLSNE